MKVGLIRIPTNTYQQKTESIIERLTLFLFLVT